jgi:GntR family transcriptional repressor for pyruvate dehydrogenase complex
MPAKEGVAKAPATAEWATSIRGPRAFEAILGQFEEALASGQLRAGDRLPAERDLTARFGASRTSVREAVRVLETFGVVEVRRGAEGARLREQPRAAFAELMRFHLALGHYRSEEVVEVRATLEAGAAASVASAADAGALERLEEIVAAMAAGEIGTERFHRLDVEFHEAVLAAAGNELATLLHRSCRALIHRSMRVALVGDWPRLRADLLGEHEAIVAAIRGEDPEAAAGAMAAHVRRWGSIATAAEGG